ncbi:MAG TPA: hypothetical protein VND40_00520 [Nitrososphaerales archaeon]|nr:hypothetical protein [Nitrososphaerales archaeon]
MKSRSLLALALIISLAVLPVAQLAFAAASSSSSSSTTTTTSTSTAPKSPYSEKVVIYTAGTNDYWLVSLSPVKALRPGIVAAESVPGVSAYELTAVQASTATTTSALFWGTGYNVLKVPFMPYSGVFLNVTATSQSAAVSAASDFGSTLGVSFDQLGSSGSNYTFFSSANFAVAGETIFSSVPASNQGLAAVATASTLAAAPTPTAILTGVRSGSSFAHTVMFGSTESGVVGTNGSLLLENALSLQNTSFVSSRNATSTQMVVHALDGLIKSPDNATVTNHVANYSATYSVSIPSGTRFRPNVSILPNPPVLTATRTVDNGAAVSGGLVSVTLNIQNTAGNGTIHNVNVNDSWWTAYPSLFSLSVGNSSFNIPSVAPGQNVSRAYVLKVSSSASDDIIIPSTPVSYSYSFGTATVNSTTRTNQVELRTNDAGPALQVQAGANIASGSSTGKPGKYVVTVTNTGNDPALNLNVLNYTNPTLVSGGVWKVNVTIPLTGIANRNVSQTFTLGWTRPDTTKGTLVSNPATILFSHSNVLLPLMQFKLTATITSKVLGLGSVNATYTLTNKGTVASGNVSVSQSFPAGMMCTRVVTGNGTCGSSGFSLATPPIAVLGSETGTLLLNFSKDSYLIGEANVTTSQNGLTLHTLGSALPIAGGVAVTKTFAPISVFQGQDDNVTVRVANQATLPVYNLTISASSDSFDTAVSSVLNAQYESLNSSVSHSLNYTVRMVSPGNHTSSSTTISYVFGGYSTQYVVSSGTVNVFKPLQATTSVASTPKEGSDFSLTVAVSNPSPVDVTNVTFSVSLPSSLTAVSSSTGVHVSGRTVTVTLPSLAAGATSSSQITLKGGFDGSFNLGSAKLTFDYLGATVTGIVSSPAIVVGVDALLRYELPIGAAVLLTLVVAVYIHRKLAVPQAK